MLNGLFDTVVVVVVVQPPPTFNASVRLLNSDYSTVLRAQKMHSMTGPFSITVRFLLLFFSIPLHVPYTRFAAD